MSETVPSEPLAAPDPEMHVELAAELAAPPPPAEVEMIEPSPATRVRVTNSLGFGIFLTVDGVDPGRVAVPRGRSVIVPTAFWEAHRALYDKASFSDLITAIPVD